MALDLAAPHPDESIVDQQDKRRAAVAWYRFFLLIASSLNGLSRSLTSTISDLAALTTQEAADIAAVTALVPGFASQAQQVAGTDTTTIVAPGTQKDNPAHPKAHGRASSGGALQTGSYGIASVAKNSAGNYTVTLSVALSAATPTIHAFSLSAGITAVGVYATATTITVTTNNDSTLAAQDAAFGIVVYGAQ